LKSQDIIEAEGVFMLEPLPCGVFVKLLVSSLGGLAGRRKVILDGIFQIHFLSHLSFLEYIAVNVSRSKERLLQYGG